MSDQQTAPPPDPQSGNVVGEFVPITNQDELNRIIGDRVKRAKPADYDDLKAKAARLDQLETASKPEIERVTARATAAEAEVATLPTRVAESLRAAVVELGLVSKEDEVLLTAATPEDLIAQIKRVKDIASSRKQEGVTRKEGRTPPPPGADPLREFARELFGTQT